MRFLKWRTILVLALLLMTTSGCADAGIQDIFGWLFNITPTPSPTITPSITPTKTQVVFKTWTATPSPEVSNTPTLAQIPTDTIKPTIRPTWTALPTKTLIPTWTSTVTMTPSITITPSPTSELESLFSEYFNEKGLWLEREASNWATRIDGGYYWMEVSAPNVEITSSRSSMVLSEVRLEADVMLKEGEG
jgi:hypothetical protein